MKSFQIKKILKKKHNVNHKYLRINKNKNKNLRCICYKYNDK